MKSKKMIIIILVVVLLSAASFLFTSPAASEAIWKKGRVTEVSDYSMTIDGSRLYSLKDSVVLKDTSGNIIEHDLNQFRGVHEILYKTEDGEITEIKIFKRKQ